MPFLTPQAHVHGITTSSLMLMDVMSTFDVENEFPPPMETPPQSRGKSLVLCILSSMPLGRPRQRRKGDATAADHSTSTCPTPVVPSPATGYRMSPRGCVTRALGLCPSQRSVDWEDLRVHTHAHSRHELCVLSSALPHFLRENEVLQVCTPVNAKPKKRSTT